MFAHLLWLLLLATPICSVVVHDAAAEVPPQFSDLPNDFNNDWELMSGIPQGADRVRAAERVLGSGSRVDLAWKTTTGRWDVRIAVLDSGVKWDERDLLYKVWLNPGELAVALPEASLTTPTTAAVLFEGPIDCRSWVGSAPDLNGDGVFNLEDYLCDARLDPRAGVDVADDIIDPSDLIALFSDGVDDDGNGYVDDIAGWDAMWDDNNPYDDTRHGHGTGEAKDSAAETNNGTGGAGVCPGCSFVPVRVGDSFITDINSFVDGAAYALAVSAAVIQEALGSLNFNDDVRRIVDLAWDRGTIVIGSAADELSYHQNPPGHADRIIFTNALAYNAPELDQATSFLGLSSCTNYGIRVDVSTPSGSCSSGAVGRLSGIAGLIVSAGRDAGLSPPLHPGEIAALLRETATDLNNEQDPARVTAWPTRPGWDPVSGRGRVDADAAVRAVAAGNVPPIADIRAPHWFAPLPATARTLSVRFVARTLRAAALHWRLLVASGGDVRDDALQEVAQGDETQYTDASMSVHLPQAKEPPSWPWRDAITIVLEVQDDAGRRTRDRRVVFQSRDRDLRPEFPITLGGSLESSPTAADLDGDGRDELIQFSNDGLLHAFRQDGSEAAGFPVALTPRVRDAHRLPSFAGRTAIASPAVADLDGDGRAEIITADLEGMVTVIDASGAVRWTWTPFADRAALAARTAPDRRLHDSIFVSPVVARFVPSGPPQIVIAAEDGTLWVLDGEGQVRDGFPVTISHPAHGRLERITSHPAVGDINGDGVAEIVIGSNEFRPVADLDGDAFLHEVYLYAVAADGMKAPGGPWLPGWPIAVPSVLPDVLPYIGRGNPNGVLLADWDPAPGLEILMTPLAGAPQIRRGDGSLIRRLQLAPPGSESGVSDLHILVPIVQPSAGDLNGDGIWDPIVPLGGLGFPIAALAGAQFIPQEHAVGAYSGRDGRLLPAYPARIEDWMFFGNPAVIDVNGDGAPEVVAGSGGYLLHAWQSDGSEPPGWPKTANGWIIATPVAADLDGDGRLELSVGTREGHLFSWDLPTPAHQPQHWPQFRHGPDNNTTLYAPPPPAPAVATGGGCRAGATGHSSQAVLLLLLGAFASRRLRRRLRRTGSGDARV